MLKFFRDMVKSKVGAALAIALLVLIALAFASGDIANTGGFGGVAGGDRVALVGRERIDTSELSQAATAALERVKREQPTMSMEAFIANGGLGQVLEDMIDRTAIAVFGRKHGIVAGSRLVDSEITQMPAFKGPDGNFSQDLFRQAIRQSGVDEKAVRQDLAQGLIARQVLVPAGYGSVAPRELVRRYAAFLTENRSGAIALFPSLAFAPEKDPSAAELESYYKSNRENFIRPERRVIRYASFDAAALQKVAAPTDAEIAARYERDRAQYAARETRSVMQLVVPTEAAARAVVAEVGTGKSLETAAREKGLEAVRMNALTQEALAQQTSGAVAKAVFAAARGALATPARSGLGWHVMRVENVETQPAQALAQVRGEIAQALSAEKQRGALNDRIAEIEGEFDSGGNLSEVAKSLDLELKQTSPLTADGQIYLQPDQQAPADLMPILQTAFLMEENEPQIAEIEAGRTFLIYDVTDIQPSAPAPLAEIRDDVTAAYRMSKGSEAAEAAARNVQAQVRKGEDFGKAVADLQKRLPPVQTINMGRQDLMRMQQQTQGQIPPPIGLLFSMAEGTIKLLPAPQDSGWFVVQLRDIEPGEVADNDELLAGAERELGQVIGGEYVDAMTRAIRAQIGVERNPAGINAVEKRLTGGS